MNGPPAQLEQRGDAMWLPKGPGTHSEQSAKPACAKEPVGQTSHLTLTSKKPPSVCEARAPDEAIQEHRQKIRGLVADELYHIRVAQEQVINVVVILVHRRRSKSIGASSVGHPHRRPCQHSEVELVHRRRNGSSAASSVASRVERWVKHRCRDGSTAQNSGQLTRRLGHQSADELDHIRVAKNRSSIGR